MTQTASFQPQECGRDTVKAEDQPLVTAAPLPPAPAHSPDGETKALRGLGSPRGSMFQSPERSSSMQGTEADPQGEYLRRIGAPPLGKALHWT